MKQFTIPQLLDEIIGSTEPYGETEHDSDAMDRLDDVEGVLSWAIERLESCNAAKNNYQFSMLALAHKAQEIAANNIYGLETIEEDYRKRKGE